MDVQGPDPSTQPWPRYSEAIVELVLDGRHLVLTPHDGEVDTQRDAEDALTAFVPPVWVLTAGDPYPAELSAADNAARLQRLCDELDAEGLVHDPALGRSHDGTASEISRAIRGADRASVLAMAARHGQLAVYEIAARIGCVDVASGTVVTSRGYTLRSAVAGSDGVVGPTGWRG
jgi:hypothetical protein